MKHVKQSRNPILREISFDTPPSNPSPIKQTKPFSRKEKFSKENNPPFEIGVVPDSSPSPSFTGKSSPVAGKLKSSSLPPRPPPLNTLKPKLSNDFFVENGSSDTGIKLTIHVKRL
ncbi:hypothetical protein L1987_01220 [Smallanthus sonchifolius]|uniref:Uncharacterized protein n=1 Tax=Smallanthus sonchifolius TaxID=185202 RepID=A0ACB9K4P6_9ASTR|nr:hypothetical protein L1987_01220 [Smallanthus sonchifolius]